MQGTSVRELTDAQISQYEAAMKRPNAGSERAALEPNPALERATSEPNAGLERNASLETNPVLERVTSEPNPALEQNATSDPIASSEPNAAALEHHAGADQGGT
nr:hypothetical protein [Paenibacillus plantiphilus]